MAAWDYDESLDELLKSEGGYSNHPSDPGGPTNYGITIADVKRFVKPDATAEDVKNLSLTTAKAIYKAKYWDVVRGDDLPPGVDYSVFDFGVNSGVSRSAKYLQRIVGVKDDGVIGDKTVAAVNDYVSKHSAKKLEDTLNEQRLIFLKHLKTWSVFGGGWGTRVEKVDTISDDMEANPGKYGKPSDPKAPTAKTVESGHSSPYDAVGSILGILYKAIQGFLKRKG